MASSRTFYDVLKVVQYAQKGEIKEAYRKLALNYYKFTMKVDGSCMTRNFAKTTFRPHGTLGMEKTGRQTSRLDVTPGVEILQHLNQKTKMAGK